MNLDARSNHFAAQLIQLFPLCLRGPCYSFFLTTGLRRHGQGRQAIISLFSSVPLRLCGLWFLWLRSFVIFQWKLAHVHPVLFLVKARVRGFFDCESVLW